MGKLIVGFRDQQVGFVNLETGAFHDYGDSRNPLHVQWAHEDVELTNRGSLSVLENGWEDENGRPVPY